MKNINIYMRNPKRVHKIFSKVLGHKANAKKSIMFIHYVQLKENQENSI